MTMQTEIGTGKGLDRINRMDCGSRSGHQTVNLYFLLFPLLHPVNPVYPVKFQRFNCIVTAEQGPKQKK
jgi:hypothetical protein